VAIYDGAAEGCANGGDVVEEDACSHVGSIEPNPFVANVMQAIADASVREAYGQGLRDPLVLLLAQKRPDSN
jgi:hypothetical protein